MNYAAELAFAKELALEAGGVMRQYFKSEELGTEWKADDTPLTVADTAINKLVIERIKAAFPEHGVLGEEESHEPVRAMFWAADPIDGTVPFSVGVPISTFLLALVDRKDGQPIVAVSYDPFLEELFYATKSGGAFMNDKPLKTSVAVGIKNNYFALGLSDFQVEGVKYDAARTMSGVRRGGGWVINVASGGYFANRVAGGQFGATAYARIGGIWDIAAPALIVQEAGGVVVDFKGQPRRFDETGAGCLLAANQTIADEILELIKGQP